MLILVNNEVFSNSKTFVNSAWLEYFLNKYTFNVLELKPVIDLAIQQEDFPAVGILLNRGYIISTQQLELAAQTRKNTTLLIKYNKENKGLDEEGDLTFYEDKNSRINDIEQLLAKFYSANLIHDTDGYTNLRQGRNSSSAIVEKIKSGAHVKVLDNTNRWYYVESMTRNKGYIYFTKIRSLK